MRTIIPLVQKHCINGISKEDAENLKDIPLIDENINGLDERVTALEQGGGGSKWEEIDVSTYAKANANVSSIFTFDGDHHYTKYPMIIIYHNEMFYVKPETSVDGSGARKFQKFTINFNNDSSPTQATEIIEEVTLYNIFLNSSVTGQDFRLPTTHIIFKTDNTMTMSGYPTFNMYRNRLNVFVKR